MVLGQFSLFPFPLTTFTTNNRTLNYSLRIQQNLSQRIQVWAPMIGGIDNDKDFLKARIPRRFH